MASSDWTTTLAWPDREDRIEFSSFNGDFIGADAVTGRRLETDATDDYRH